MFDWSYFRLLAVGLGVGMVLEAVAFQLLSERSRRTMVELFAPREGPRPWIQGATVLYLVWLADLWRRALLEPVPHGWVLATLMSLGLIKTWAYTNRYRDFRRWLRQVLTDPRRLRGLCLFELLLGPTLIVLGFTLY